MTHRLLSVFMLVTVACLISFQGCSSDDDSSNNNNNNTSSRIYVDLKANTQFTFVRTSLDSANNKIASTAHNYVVDLKGNGGLYQGAYKDWFYRIGTDAVSMEKDTAYLRTNTGSASGASFTKEVMMYGFVNQVHQSLVDMIMTAFPIATPPNVAGPDWDIVAMYCDQNGSGYDVGKEWTVGSASGSDLNFVIASYPVPINVKIKGKLEAKDEIIKVGAKDVKTWKASMYVTISIANGLSTATLKMTSWFSEDPDGPIKMLQESTSITIPFLNQKLPINGEVQELSSYRE
jgi:hypothetical protein